MRRLRCILLHRLHRLRDDGRQRREDVAGLDDDALRRLGQHAIERAPALVILQQLHLLADVDAARVLGQVQHGRGVPQGDVLLEVLEDHRQVLRRDQLAAAQRRAGHVREVRLEVRDVVLLRERDDGLAHGGRDVLVDGVLLLRLKRRRQQLLVVRDAERLEQPLLDLALVVQLRHRGGACRHGLHLREPLRLAEDGRVADRHHVHGALEVGARGQLLADFTLGVVVVEVHAVEAVQDVERPRHGIVQSAVDRREHGHALLDQCQCRADRRVGVLVGEVVHRRAHDALAGVDHEAQQLEQRRAGRVERDRHGDLAHVIDVDAALDLLDLRRLDVQRLPAARAALQLEHRRHVLDVRAVHQCAQCAGRGSGQAADHVRQADRVCAAPRDERELDEPRQCLAALVLFVPVAVDRQHLAAGLVDGEDVRRIAVALDVGHGVYLEHGAQAVLVVRRVAAALDLVVGHVGTRTLRLHARRRQLDVAVHARLYTFLVVELRQILHVCLALRAVEVGRGERQVHVVDRDEQEVRPVARLVPRQLEVLRAAEWHLRQQLLQLAAERLALHRELPVHHARLALGLLQLLDGDLALDQVLHRTLRGQQFADGARREVDARLGHHRVHDLRRALKLRAAGRVVTEAGAADALLVLLVAFLAGFLVLADQVEEARRQGVQLAVRHVLGEVRVELAVARSILLAHAHDRATVLGVLDIGRIVLVDLDHLAFSHLVFVVNHASVLTGCTGW